MVVSYDEDIAGLIRHWGTGGRMVITEHVDLVQRYIMKEKVDLSLNRSLEELESSYWEFLEATEGEDSSEWSKSVQEDLSALEGYLMKMDVL